MEDNETGEAYPDYETGEISFDRPTFDPETGENVLEYANVRSTTFKVPSALYGTSSNRGNRLGTVDNQHDIELVAAAVFLLPTVILFYPILGVAAVVLEMALHKWSHEKNDGLRTDAGWYYRSPLHVIVKEFCATCRDENDAMKITKLQDKKNDKFRLYGSGSRRPSAECWLRNYFPFKNCLN